MGNKVEDQIRSFHKRTLREIKQVDQLQENSPGLFEKLLS